MRKLLLIVILAMVAILMMGCDEEGELRIRNRTSSQAWASVSGGANIQIEPGTSWAKLYSNETDVEVTYYGHHVFPASETRHIYLGLPSTVNIIATGGAIKISNDGALGIQEVYISPEDSTAWGNDLMPSVIPPNGSQSWTCTAGEWDIKVVLSDGTTLYMLNPNATVALDATTNLLLSSFSTVGTKEKKPGTYLHKSGVRINPIR
jgi:hypothetical protein